MCDDNSMMAIAYGVVALLGFLFGFAIGALLF